MTYLYLWGTRSFNPYKLKESRIYSTSTCSKEHLVSIMKAKGAWQDAGASELTYLDKELVAFELNEPRDPASVAAAL